MMAADGMGGRCGGVFLSEAAIVEKIGGHQLDLGRPRRAELACPVCSKPMPSAGLFEIPIDRCSEHGIWFDKTELDQVIARAHNDEWRLYGTGGASEARGYSFFGELIDALFKKRGA